MLFLILSLIILLFFYFKNQKNKNILNQNTYWLTATFFVKYTAFIYLITFLTAITQNASLIGQNGILPADLYISKLCPLNQNLTFQECFFKNPTIFVFFQFDDSKLFLIEFIGIIISISVIFHGPNMIKMAILWFLYLSIVNIGQTWYSFGWESQLLETGFLTIFLSPLFSSSFINKKMLKKTDQSNLSYKLQNETIKIYSILGRWLLFRIMLGAGLIKLRGDSCWWDLTCMKYHYQTQPIPNILSYYLHFLSEFWHKFEVLGNHFVEILAPFMLFFNRKLIMIGGLIQIAFQCTIILSGNLSFLNWLTIAPAIFCFDDKALSPFFSKNTVQIVKQMQLHSNFKKEQPKKFNIIQIFKAFLKFILALIILALIGYKSIPIIENLFFSKNQIMNTSFDQFRLVNTYGAFGSITKQRFEVVIQGTIDREISENTEWKEYEFYCKPGNIYQIPCNISPFHLRIDWLMWFAGFQSYHQNPWIFHLSMKLIAGHKQITNTFFKYDPFPQGTELPNTIRALLYEYKFSENQDGNQWYERKFVREYMPPFQLDNPKLKGFYKQLKQFGWKIPTRSPQDWQISKQNENKRYKEKRSKNNGKLEKKEEI